MSNVRLTADEFSMAANLTRMSSKTVKAVRQVLVDGQRLSEVAKEFCLDKSSLHRAIKIVMAKYQERYGLEYVEAFLPPHQASVVREWASVVRFVRNK